MKRNVYVVCVYFVAISFRCNIFFGVRIIKEMPGLIGSGTTCITLVNFQLDAQNSYLFIYNTFIKIYTITT
jgi:hypothetical protein